MTMKILILTAKCGMGHYQCARAIRERMLASPSSGSIDRIDIVDIYEEKSATRAKMFYKLYDQFVDRGGALYNFSYKQMQKMKDKRHLFKLLDHMLVENFDLILKDYKPDLVISTYSFASELMSAYKGRNGSALPLVTWITDVNPHTGWVNPHTDLYVVADASSREMLLRMGVDKRRIRIGGIPVSTVFDQASRALVHRDKRILVMGGGLGLLPKSKAFYKKLASIEGVSVSVVCGKNKALYHMLTRHFPEIQTYGYVNNISELMAEADLLLTKAGGVTTFEAIQSEKPMIIFKPFLEQELHNANYIEAMRIGFVLPSRLKKSKRDIPYIAAILGDDRILKSMENNTKRLKKGFDADVYGAIIQSKEAVEC